MKNKLKSFFHKYVAISIKDVALSGILIGLYLIVDRFITFNIQGVMHIGITFVFLIMFGIVFGPIKGVFFALVADTIKMFLITGIAKWMWEYEIITVGIPLMAWAFKYFFNAKKIQWWISMLIVNIIILLGMIIVIVISHDDPLKHMSKRLFKSSRATNIMVYIMAALMILVQTWLFIAYAKTNNKEIKLIISIGTLVMMIVVVWIWIWGPIAYVRYLERFGRNRTPNHYSYAGYYKLALWGRILKTPIIVPLYTAILIPLYKATEITLKKFNISDKSMVI